MTDAESCVVPDADPPHPDALRPLLRFLSFDCDVDATVGDASWEFDAQHSAVLVQYSAGGVPYGARGPEVWQAYSDTLQPQLEGCVVPPAIPSLHLVCADAV